jgi:hypothetical protein
VTASITHFLNFLQIVRHINPYIFDANVRTIEGSPVHVSVTSLGERVGIDLQKVRWKHVRRWESRPSAAYASEFT